MHSSTNCAALDISDLRTSPRAFKILIMSKDFSCACYLLLVQWTWIKCHVMNLKKQQQQKQDIVPLTVGWGSIGAWHFHFRLDHDKHDKCQTSCYIARYCLKIHVNVFTRVTHSFTCLRSVWFALVVGSQRPTPTLNIDFEAYNDTRQKYSLHPESIEYLTRSLRVRSHWALSDKDAQKMNRIPMLSSVRYRWNLSANGTLRSAYTVRRWKRHLLKRRMQILSVWTISKTCKRHLAISL